MGEILFTHDSYTFNLEDNNGNSIVVQFGLSARFEPEDCYPDAHTIEEIEEAYRKGMEEIDKEFEKYFIEDFEDEEE